MWGFDLIVDRGDVWLQMRWASLGLTRVGWVIFDGHWVRYTKHDFVMKIMKS